MIKCIIVDDEPHCIESLRHLIVQFPLKLSLVDTFSTAEAALDYLENNSVDLIFSDIQMNKMTGLEFAQMVNGRSKVIFTTAHKDYATESYNFNALDYLQKPIDFDRFKKAIDKIPTISFNADGTFFVKEGFKKININLKEVSFIEANGGYLKIHNAKTKETTLTLCSLNEFEKQLKPYNFYRIHNSYMVHLPFIASYDANYVEINLGTELKKLSISNRFRHEFFKAMPTLGR